MTKNKFIEIPGLNVQSPWGELIVSGQKTVETRSYPLPKKHENVAIAIIETPGPKKLVSKARIVGIVIFSHSLKYINVSEWRNDKRRHLIDADHVQFKFDRKKAKYGWIVKSVVKLPTPLVAPKYRGIVFASKCRVPKDFLSFLTIK